MRTTFIALLIIFSCATAKAATVDELYVETEAHNMIDILDDYKNFDDVTTDSELGGQLHARLVTEVQKIVDEAKASVNCGN